MVSNSSYCTIVLSLCSNIHNIMYSLLPAGKTTTVVFNQRWVDTTAKRTQVLPVKRSSHARSYSKAIRLNIKSALVKVVNRLRDKLLKKWRSLKKACINIVHREPLE
jgi:hypothetical protein